jgi:hypothetical protein
MPTLTLEGPASDPALSGPTEPLTPPPVTRVAPTAVVPVGPPSQPAPRRRRSRAAALISLSAIAGAATGAVLAILGIGLPIETGEHKPTGRDALASVRSVGDYTTAPRDHSVTMGFSIPESCALLVFWCDDGGDITYRATGSFNAMVPVSVVSRRDVMIRRGTAFIRVPSAELGEVTVDPNSIEELDRTIFDGSGASDDEIIDYATEKISARASRSGITLEAQRAVRRLIVTRLHSLGFERVRVLYV